MNNIGQFVHVSTVAVATIWSLTGWRKPKGASEEGRRGPILM